MSALRSVPDRLRQLLLFEIIGLVLVAPLASWLTGDGIGTLGVLVFAISLIAMAWSGGFNYLFDRIELARGGHLSRRGWGVRVLHASLFELGLTLITLPLIVWMLKLPVIEALLLNVGFIVFYLLYALLFNRAYDALFPLRED
ncbi:PACE efflux transporter [Sulfuriferula sp.]|uniref:PACE efflux transporter n=1 Tax=Sulfuriferula sp. TaxID=2025307 RepID=UPI00272FCD8B|nr:PACE efflux transporter [Sulfuriferula sp.]MDP2024946.1 PACE efflux transporter [Sulfuriferula sp.]